MARFYFEPDKWGATFEDHSGVDRVDLNKARESAAHAARNFMHVEAARGRPCSCCCVEVVIAADMGVRVTPADAAASRPAP